MGLILKIALVTDSSSYLTQTEVEKYNITVVPIPVIIDDVVYQENIDLNADKLYELQKSGSDFPKTSQPSIGEMVDLFTNLREKGYDEIIAITLAGTISGFNQSLVGLASTNQDLHLHVFDSEITVRLMGYMVIAASKMITAGYNVNQIMDKLAEIRATTDEIFVVDDLNNLVRGGRLSNASGLVGSMLQIKPLLTFDNDTHKITSFDKVRSMKKALIKSKKLMNQRISENKDADDLRIIIYHANDLETAEKLKEELTTEYPKLPIEIAAFGPVVATHLGEKAIGLTWMIDVEKMKF